MTYIFLVPWWAFFLSPWNSDRVLHEIIIEEPLIANFTNIYPAAVLDKHHIFFTLIAALYPTASVLVVIVAVIIYIIYVRKVKSVNETLSQSTAAINAMLFRALTVQLILLMTNFYMPLLVMEIAIYADVRYANFISIMTFFPILLYPIAEVSALFYFIKPYREFLWKTIQNVVAKIKPKVSNVISTF